MRIVRAALLLLCACGGGATPGGGGVDAGGLPVKADSGALPAANRAPELGRGDHSPGSVALTVIAEGLAKPRDLAFNPRVPAQLWVVNAGDNSVAIIHDATTTPNVDRRQDMMHGHFMPAPSAIAFGADATTIGRPGTFATTQESNNHGNDFMGPVLWSSDLEVFARMNGELGSHLDMLHCSPWAMGIAWERANVYWVFGGARPGAPGESDITRYDFNIDHGVGNDDHADNTKHHYLRGQVKRQPGVPSHLYFHEPSKYLLIADTGNGRVLWLDTMSGRPGAVHRGLEPTLDDRLIDDAVTGEIVPAGGELVRPSGIEMKGDVVFVSDNATGIFYAFGPDGAKLNWLETGLPAGALMGLTFGPDGRLYFVDAVGSRVLRVDPR